jgi:hypothetical protein
MMVKDFGCRAPDFEVLKNTALAGVSKIEK